MTLRQAANLQLLQCNRGRGQYCNVTLQPTERRRQVIAWWWFGDNKVGWWAGRVKSPLHKVRSCLYWSLILSTCADRRRCLLVCLDVAQQLVCSYFNSYWCDLTTPTQILYLHLKELQVWHTLGCGECRRSEYCRAATELLKYFLSGKGGDFAPNSLLSEAS